MATYPAIDGKGKATPIRDVEVRFEESDGIAIRGQNLSEQNLYDIVITHSIVTSAELVTLREFFDTNRNTTITTQQFEDGHTYTGTPTDEPDVFTVNGVHARVIQTLKGTRV